MKRCPRCERWLNVVLFGWDRSRSDGRNVYCRECIGRRNNRDHYSTKAYILTHLGPRRRSAFGMRVRMKLDRFERQHHEVYVDCEDKVWRWGNFRRPAFESMAEWMARVAERGLSVEWL